MQLPHILRNVVGTYGHEFRVAQQRFLELGGLSAMLFAVVVAAGSTVERTARKVIHCSVELGATALQALTPLPGDDKQI
jgi:hypothetical protein